MPPQLQGRSSRACPNPRALDCDRPDGDQPPRAAAISWGSGVIVLASRKVSAAWETLIGAGLGSPLGVISKLPTIPSLTWVLKRDSITPALVPSPDWIAGIRTSAA